MKLIHAVYERGVFRPTDPVELPDGCCVEFEPQFTVEATANDSLRRRLDELRQLRDGWLDGNGLAPSTASLDWLSQQFDGRYPGDLPLPFTYPTAEGGIQCEWSVGGFEASLEIDLQTYAGQWHRLNLKTEASDLIELDLNSDDDWDVLTSEIRRGVRCVGNRAAERF